MITFVKYAGDVLIPFDFFLLFFPFFPFFPFSPIFTFWHLIHLIDYIFFEILEDNVILRLCFHLSHDKTHKVEPFTFFPKKKNPKKTKKTIRMILFILIYPLPLLCFKWTPLIVICTSLSFQFCSVLEWFVFTLQLCNCLLCLIIFCRLSIFLSFPPFHPSFLSSPFSVHLLFTPPNVLICPIRCFFHPKLTLSPHTWALVWP